MANEPNANEQIIFIDNFGNMVTEGGDYIGYFDADLNACFLINGTSTPCPTNFKKPTEQPTVKSTRTFYWVFLAGFIGVVIIIAYLINKRKTA